MKDYNKFKEIMLFIKRELAGQGVEITLKGWRKLSPYQKRRYKPEFVYPEVWVYKGGASLGMVITGEEVEDKKIKDLIELLKY